MKTLFGKSAMLSAAVFAALVLAAPLEAEAHGSGNGHRGSGFNRHNNFPMFDFRLFLPHGSFDRHRHGFQHQATLPRRAIKRMLKRQHFRHIRHLILRDDIYHARARDSFGRKVFLKIDAYNGLVIRLRYR